MNGQGHVKHGLLGVVAIVFLTAPTVGDVGSCGRTATDLNISAYENARKILDCQRCTDCGLTTKRCKDACNPAVPPEIDVPSTCHPLFHDGEVCVRALEAASCDDYASYVDDVSPSIPGECDFCHVGGDTLGGTFGGSSGTGASDASDQ